MTSRLSGVSLYVDDNQKDIALSYRDMSLLADNNASGSVVYLGRAVAGTNSSASGWQIKNYAYDSNGIFSSALYADGNIQFDNAWTARSGLTYL